MANNQRLLAARQLAFNLLNKSPLVQAVKQKSLAPYKAPLSNALSPGSLMPMGRLKGPSKAVQNAYDPKLIAQGSKSFMADRQSMLNRWKQEAIQRVAMRRQQTMARMSQPRPQITNQNLISKYLANIYK